MRPKIPDELACRVNEYVKSQYGVAPDSMDFAARLRLVMNDAEPDSNDDESGGSEAEPETAQEVQNAVESLRTSRFTHDAGRGP